MSTFLRLSLLHGWVPAVVSVAAWGALGLGVAWRQRKPWHWIVIAAGAFAAVGVAAVIVDVPARFGNTIPRSFLAWVALPLFALGAALWQWPVANWWRRAVAVAAVPSFVVFGALQINAHYAYLPTIGDALGAPLPGQVDARTIDGLSPRLTDRGVVSEIDIPATVSHFRHRPAWVWLPPVYFAASHPHLPVLMLLTGTPGTPTDWMRAGGALTLANAWARGHDGYAPIMVFPDSNSTIGGDTECVDGPRGRAETYLTVDVPRFMHKRFHTSTEAQRWAIVGASEGGTCALVLVARHPGEFATFGDFSGDAVPNLGSQQRTLRVLYGGSEIEDRAHDPNAWFDVDAADGVRGFAAAGTAEHGHVLVATQLADAARRERVDVHLDLIPGGSHNFRTWKHALRDAYPWLVARLGLPSRPSTVSHHSD